VHEQEAAAGAGMALQYTKNTWPMSIIERPLVVAPGMAEASFGLEKDLSPDSVFNAHLHPLAAGVYARYGVSDRIHAGLDTSFVCFVDCAGAGFFKSLALGAGYAVIAEHDMNLVPAVTFALYNISQSLTGGALMFAFQPGFLFGWRMSRNLQLFTSSRASKSRPGSPSRPPSAGHSRSATPRAMRSRLASISFTSSIGPSTWARRSSSATSRRGARTGLSMRGC
jgi:hypothetical protein